jgi:pfkB family carbohydrate kinase
MVALAPPPGESLRRAARWLVDHAGAESNTCVGLARLGLRVSWVSCLGRDAAGDRVLDALAAEGVDTAWVRRDPQRPTGVMLKDPAGVRYYRTGSAASVMGPDLLDAVPAAQARAVLVTGVTALIGARPPHRRSESAPGVVGVRSARGAGAAVHRTLQSAPGRFERVRGNLCWVGWVGRVGWVARHGTTGAKGRGVRSTRGGRAGRDHGRCARGRDVERDSYPARGRRRFDRRRRRLQRRLHRRPAARRNGRRRASVRRALRRRGDDLGQRHRRVSAKLRMMLNARRSIDYWCSANAYSESPAPTTTT